MKRISSSRYFHATLLSATAFAAAYVSSAHAADRHGRGSAEPSVEIHLDALDMLRTGAHTTASLSPETPISAENMPKLQLQQGLPGQPMPPEQLNKYESQPSTVAEKPKKKTVKVAKAQPVKKPKAEKTVEPEETAKVEPAPAKPAPKPAEMAAAQKQQPAKSRPVKKHFDVIEEPKETVANEPPPPPAVEPPPPPAAEPAPQVAANEPPPPPAVEPPPPPAAEPAPPPVAANEPPPPPAVEPPPPPVAEPAPQVAANEPPPPPPVIDKTPPAPEKPAQPQLLGQMSDSSAASLAPPPVTEKTPPVQIAKQEPEPAPDSKPVELIPPPDQPAPPTMADKAPPAAEPPPPVAANEPPPPAAAESAPAEAAKQVASLTPPPPGGGAAPDLQVTFNANDTVVPEPVRAKLSEVAARLKQNEQLRVSVVGFASGSSDQMSTARRVSLARALAVRAYLIDQGVDTLRINVQAEGNTQSSMPDRVDVFLVTPAKG